MRVAKWPRAPLLWLGLIVFLIGCSTGEVAPTEPSVDEAALAEFMAQALVTSYRDIPPQTQALIAHIELPSETGSYSPLQVWQYEKGRLAPASVGDFERALGSDRSQWPGRTILFAFETLSPEAAVAEIRTILDQGIVVNSRGGFASKWHLVNQAGQWQVERREEPYLHWD